MFRRLLPFLAILAVPLLAPYSVTAEPPAEAEQPAAEPPVHAEGDPLPVPPGTPADQALWQATREVSSTVAQVRYASNKMLWQVKTSDLVARLDKAAAANPADAKRLGELKTRLERARDENMVMLTGRWPVDPTRVCQYTLIDLQSAMFATGGERSTPELNEARDRAAACTTAAKKAAESLDASNKKLAAVIAEVEKSIPPIQPATPAKPAGK